MQTYLISFATAEARTEGSKAIREALQSRRTDMVDHAPSAPEITAPVLGTDEDSLPTVITPGIYGQVSYPVEVVIHDNDAAPAWPEGATVTTTTSSFAFKPVAETEGQQTVAASVFPDTISDRQFAQGLAHAGLITHAEALAWVGPGTLPASIAGFLQSLPEQMRFDAEILLVGATQFKRSHPMTATFSAAVGMTPQQLDQFWMMCASL